MITTIQLHADVKEALNRMKKTPRESYEDIIVRMMKMINKNKKEHEKLMKEGCIVMAEESKKLAEEWMEVSTSADWEWKK
jgi:predicted CopG family antitoxin